MGDAMKIAKPLLAGKTDGGNDVKSREKLNLILLKRTSVLREVRFFMYKYV